MRKYSRGSVQKYHGEWRAIVSFQKNGAQHRLTKNTGIRCFPNDSDNRGKQNAERFLRQWRDELVLAEAEQADHITSKDPFIEFCRRYADARLHIVKDSTYLGYLSEINRLVGSGIDSMPICDISSAMISKHESELLENGLSSTTVMHHHAFMAAVFKDAAASRQI